MLFLMLAVLEVSLVSKKLRQHKGDQTQGEPPSLILQQASLDSQATMLMPACQPRQTAAKAPPRGLAVRGMSPFCASDLAGRFPQLTWASDLPNSVVGLGRTLSD